MKKLIGATVALASLTTSSCIGPNNAYNGVLAWNSTCSDSKYLNELVFLGLNIIPVYPVCMLGDYIVFNSVEFWTGSNWIGKPGEYKPQEK
jgi:hypothetical protein